MEYRAIEEGIQFSRARKATSYKGAIIAAVCVVAAGAFFLSGSGNSELALAQTRTAGVSCRNVRTAAQMDRRAVLGGLFGAAAFGAAKSAQALQEVELIDDRKAKKSGFDIIYEARDLDLDQNTRDGMTQARTGIQETKKRVLGTEKKLQEAGSYVDKKYWSEGRTVLRRLVGTLRFDLAALANSKTGGAKKDAIKANKDFFEALESLDLAMYKKNVEAGQKAYQKTIAAYKSAVSLY
eukprot:CAMPEP_0185263640 /NCGR_PEP_ID=MMETSP1359-20130426/15383_1 /TAXON_ID=552665 /ORGANISM="Bigelowiella longifila, Strain CCMP242" /LENGTH=237 /DNA_ID=CAMNT_0027851297 /DNA_START=15 /DNA_END=728 /DNA_ORIENTATION=+